MRIVLVAYRSCHARLPIDQPPKASEPRRTAPPGTDTDTVPVEIGSALERLMARFTGLARRAARARGLSADEIEEILQDVRIRLWKAHPHSENLERLGASYFVKVVTSSVVDLLRKRRRADTSLDVELAQTAVPVALQIAAPDMAERDALASRLERALALLPRNRRLVVQLHLEGYERHEMSGMTGWTEAKVRNLLYRGLDDLRAILRSDGGQSDA